MATFEEIQKQNLQKYIQQTGNQDAQARLQAWNTGGKDPGAGYKGTSQAIQQTASYNNPSQDLFKLYNEKIFGGSSNADSLAKDQSSRIAQEQRDKLNAALQSAQTNRDVGLKGVENSLAGAKQSLEDTSFQKYLAARQAMSNRGLSGSGLAQDQDTRLALSRQRDLAGIERDAADRRYALDAQFNDQSKAIQDQMGNIDESGLYNELFAQYRAQEAQLQAQKANQIMQAIQAMAQEEQRGLDNQFRQSQFQYGQQQDALERRDKDKQNNIDMARWFTQTYGVPVSPRESYDNLLAQVKGVKPLNVQEFDFKKQQADLDNQRWASEFEVDQAYKNAQLGIDQQRLGMQWNDMMTGLEKEGFNRLMDTWKMTGKAPKGLESYGIQAGTTIYDPSAQKQQQVQAEEFKNEQVGMIDAVRSGQMTVQDAFKQIQVDKTLGFYSPAQAKQLEDTLKSFHANTYGFGPPNPQGGYQGTTGFKNKQGGGEYNNYWKTEKSAKANPTAYQSTTKTLLQAVDQTGVPQNWIPALLELTARESSWNPNAKNPKSSARGLFQFLDSTRKNYAWNGVNWNDPVHQSIAGIQYIKDRYGTPEKALAHWDDKKWY